MRQEAAAKVGKVPLVTFGGRISAQRREGTTGCWAER